MIARAMDGSELVMPLVKGGRMLGVLDLDSPVRGRFDDDDRAGCERLVAVFLDHQQSYSAGLP